MRPRPALAALPLLLLAACGDSPAEEKADALEEAAEYSTPDAANVLENEAEEIRETGEAPEGVLDNAIEEAADAEQPAAR